MHISVRIAATVLAFTSLSALGQAGGGGAKKKTSEVEEQRHQARLTMERGRAIYEYDQTAWHGTDAIAQLKPDTKGLARFLCIPATTGWKVVVPKWDDTKKKLVVAYQATEDPKTGKFTAVKNDPPVEPKEDLMGMEQALATATLDLGNPGRPYNSAILPAGDGNFYVYLYPGQTKENIWPLGGDVRYTISGDGKKIVEKRQLHKGILDTEYTKDAVAGVHAHVLSDMPEDTDVLYVLNRHPHIPEYIAVTAEKVWLVRADGSITLAEACGKPTDATCKVKDKIKEALEKAHAADGKPAGK